MTDLLTEERLQAEADQAAQTAAFRAALWRHCRYLRSDASPEQLKTRIHPGDQMLLHSLKHFHEVNRPLSQYYNVALQQHDAAQQILHHVFPSRPANLQVLDFACGYGRLLRFLSLSIPPEQIWAAEIQAGAVDFVVQEYGVHGLLSQTEPASFEPGRRFDFIWVASLFSHLPETLFKAWIGKLHSLLSPRGVLCFSVHDQCLLPEGTVLPDSGIRFTPDSENADLDTCNYGTTHVGEAFVARAIGDSLGRPGHPYARLPRGLANEQDLYVVAADPSTDLTGLRGFRRGAWGWVDGLEFAADGRLEMHGWAASLDDGPLDEVIVELDGQTHRCPTGALREDVARVLNDPRLALSGWRFATTLPATGGKVFLQVSGRTTRGETALLYTGTLAVPAPTISSDPRPTPPTGLLSKLKTLLSGRG